MTTSVSVPTISASAEIVYVLSVEGLEGEVVKVAGDRGVEDRGRRKRSGSEVGEMEEKGR